MDEDFGDLRASPRPNKLKLLEIHERAQKPEYTSSLLASSATNLRAVVDIQTAKNIELANDISTELDNENINIHLAWNALRWCMLVFTLIIVSVLLDRLGVGTVNIRSILQRFHIRKRV